MKLEEVEAIMTIEEFVIEQNKLIDITTIF